MRLPINIPVVEFVRRLSSCKKISPSRTFLMTVYLIKLIIVMPAAFLQFLFYNRRISKTVITKPPICIMGHKFSREKYKEAQEVATLFRNSDKK
jgi:hypothetical protein